MLYDLHAVCTPINRKTRLTSTLFRVDGVGCWQTRLDSSTMASTAIVSTIKRFDFKTGMIKRERHKEKERTVFIRVSESK